MGIITLTTDFGGRDYFAGSMKGVILGINPDAQVVDISHDVASHDIWGAAYLLGAAYGYFPARTVHVAVVDPGVGSPRRPILAVTDKHFFLGPDNGVLSFVFNDPGFSRVLHMTSEHYFLPSKGSTFHARDVFAPAAAWLSKGVPAEKFGEEITDFVRFNIPSPNSEGEGVSGEVVYVDKFGNAITCIQRENIAPEGNAAQRPCSISFNETTLDGISPYYSSVKRGEPGAVINGNGYLEIFVFQGDARRGLGLKRGDKVKVSFR